MKRPIKVLSVFGTRPEAIKMVPVIKALELDERFQSRVVVTAQHREMLDQVLQTFQIQPEYDLDVMTQGQSLTDLTGRILNELEPILKTEKPAVVLVHGDTTTAYAAAIAAFYQQISIGHVEAGLRTWNKTSPFPEEANRQMIDILADIHFAPTNQNRLNLLKENHSAAKIYVTGNTAIDVMKYTLAENYQHPCLSKGDNRQILITMHRRENLGRPMKSVFRALKRIALEFSDVNLIFPIHRNPQIRRLARERLEGIRNIDLIEPLDVVDFHNLAAHSYLIMTDSGGIQEEAPSLGVPVLVLRDTTERPEGLEAGTLKLVGTEEEAVYQGVKQLLVDPELVKKMSNIKNPYGDGQASQRILDAISARFGESVKTSLTPVYQGRYLKRELHQANDIKTSI